MADFVHGPDRLYGQISITGDNNQLVVPFSGIDEIITLTPRDDYYVHLDTSKDGVHGYSLLSEIQTKINAFAASDHSIVSATPDGSQLTESGIRFKYGTSTADLTLKFSSASWTLDPRLLGWPKSQAVDVTVSTPTVEVKSPHSLHGVFQSWNIADNAASDKTSFPFQNIVLSSDNVTQAARKKMLEKKPRTMRWDWVPGAHIFENRANDLASANTAGLPQGDVNNSIIAWWRLATGSDEDGRLAKVIIVHDKGEDGYEEVFGDHYEIARLSDEGQIQDASQFLRRLRMPGEYYRIELDFDVIAGAYDQ